MQFIFLDANVIANWILIKEIIQKFEDLKDDKILSQRFKSISYSYTLIEALLETNEYSAKTSNLALAEVYPVIYEEMQSFKMYLEGIPLTLWKKLRRSFDLTKDEKRIVRDVVLRYFNELRKKVEIVNDILDEEIYPFLILECNLKTHDALLLTTACLNDCSWFITNDREIVRLKKRASFPITPDLPENFLREVSIR